MSFLRKLFSGNTKHENNQEDNPNRAVLTLCRHIGYPEVNIRRALLDLNGINVRRLANGVGVPTLYGAIKEANRNPMARIALADCLGLRVEEIFAGPAPASAGQGEPARKPRRADAGREGRTPPVTEME